MKIVKYYRISDMWSDEILQSVIDTLKNVYNLEIVKSKVGKIDWTEDYSDYWELGICIGCKGSIVNHIKATMWFNSTVYRWGH